MTEQEMNHQLYLRIGLTLPECREFALECARTEADSSTGLMSGQLDVVTKSLKSLEIYVDRDLFFKEYRRQLPQPADKLESGLRMIRLAKMWSTLSVVSGAAVSTGNVIGVFERGSRGREVLRHEVQHAVDFHLSSVSNTLVRGNNPEETINSVGCLLPAVGVSILVGGMSLTGLLLQLDGMNLSCITSMLTTPVLFYWLSTRVEKYHNLEIEQRARIRERDNV